MRATINLCAEMPDGDAPAIAAAGLAGQLRTTHIPITDMESPTVDQLTEMMDLLSGPDGELTYVHCEAGRGRTGVVIACYRMAVTGWGVADALAEAVNFGCIVPGQQAFIREFGETLRDASLAGRYPLLPFGSVSATPAQLSATFHAAADVPEAGSPRRGPEPERNRKRSQVTDMRRRRASITWVPGPAAPVSAQRRPRAVIGALEKMGTRRSAKGTRPCRSSLPSSMRNCSGSCGPNGD